MVSWNGYFLYRPSTTLRQLEASKENQGWQRYFAKAYWYLCRKSKREIQIKLKEDNLFVATEGLPDMLLYAENKNIYYLENYNDTLTFSDDRVVIHAHGRDFTYFKTDSR